MADSPALRTLAATLRGRRQALGLTQGEVAARAGVSRQWVSGLEGGKESAELGLVLRVVDVLGLRMDLRADDEPTTTPDRSPVDLDAVLDDYETGDDVAATTASPADR